MTAPLPALHFDNRFVHALPGDPEQSTRRREVRGAAWSAVQPTPVSNPHLLAHAHEVAGLLDLTPEHIASQAIADVFGGNALLPGMQPYAANYGGHQFGTWAGQLGDGRAITLGEAINARGERWEIQLKGAGPTPYSRTADGRAVLRSSIREFLCSEAMHHLGVPTTRALCLIGTGESVVRDMFYDGHAKAEPGAIVCRVAPSFLRFGNFQLPASRDDIGLLRQLVDFSIARDFPHIEGDGEARIAAWFGDICERTAVMVAHWMRVGFVHGVMNTDNMSVLGLTIDYGPYGWIDNFDPDWTPNTTDAQGRRYRFGWQPRVAGWNLSRLAQALSPLFDGVEPLQAGLQRYADTYAEADRSNIARKLGFAHCEDADLQRMEDLHVLLHDGQVDMTLFFRALMSADPDDASLSAFDEAFYHPTARAAVAPALAEWLHRYARRLERDALPADTRIETMRLANPRFVLRNYLAQQAIDAAEAGDPGAISELLDVMRRPYDEQHGRERFARRRPDWARERAGCSMLSCSS